MKGRQIFYAVLGAIEVVVVGREVGWSMISKRGRFSKLNLRKRIIMPSGGF